MNTKFDEIYVLHLAGDKKDIEYYFNHFPEEDFGVIKYHSITLPYTGELTYSKYTDNVNILSCACYTLSESGMKAYIKEIDNRVQPADMVFYKESFRNKSNIYYVNKQIVDIRPHNVSNII